MLSRNDLIYLATIMFLTTRGGAIKDSDIEQAQFVASKVFDKIFDEEKEEPVTGLPTRLKGTFLG